MRTTLTLDDDVAIAFERLPRAGDASFKDIVNDALRRGLSDLTTRLKQPEPFQTQGVSLGRLQLPSFGREEASGWRDSHVAACGMGAASDANGCLPAESGSLSEEKKPCRIV
jgi:hypothetical protein